MSNVVVKASKIEGKGVFAARDFKEGDSLVMAGCLSNTKQ